MKWGSTTNTRYYCRSGYCLNCPLFHFCSPAFPPLVLLSAPVLPLPRESQPRFLVLDRASSYAPSLTFAFCAGVASSTFGIRHDLYPTVSPRVRKPATRRLPPRPQARKPATQRRWEPQGLRLRTLCFLRGVRQDVEWYWRGRDEKFIWCGQCMINMWDSLIQWLLKMVHVRDLLRPLTVEATINQLPLGLQ